MCRNCAANTAVSTRKSQRSETKKTPAEIKKKEPINANLPDEALKEMLDDMWADNVGFMEACRAIAVQAGVATFSVQKRAFKMGLNWMTQRGPTRPPPSVAMILKGPARQHAIMLFREAKFEGGVD